MGTLILEKNSNDKYLDKLLELKFEYVNDIIDKLFNCYSICIIYILFTFISTHNSSKSFFILNKIRFDIDIR